MDSRIIERTTCRVCGSPKLTPLFSLGTQAVSDFVPADKVHAGVQCPLDVVLCEGCTLVQLKHTAPQDFLYTRHYWYRSGVTQTMRDALADVARAACERVNLKPGDVVLDIGSNDGTLLRFFPDDCVRVGVEPANNLATAENYRGLTLIHDFWNSRSYFEVATSSRAKALMSGIGHPRSDLAKIVTACGCFYDLEDPSAFIADVAKVLHPEGVFIAQLMCLKQTLELRDVGNFAHEHLEFYSLKSLEHLFNAHGLMLYDVEENEVNGGSYRLFVRHEGASVGAHDPHGPDYGRIRDALEAEYYLSHPEEYVTFVANLEINRKRCVDFIRSEVAKGKTVWVYGASTKGNVILQYYGLGGAESGDYLITAAADRSPEKVGLYTVGTGIPIVSEAEFRKAAPDYALVLPYAFLPEFMEREAAWRANGGRFLVPLPEFKVV